MKKVKETPETQVETQDGVHVMDAIGREQETTTLVCQAAFRLEIDGLSLEIPRGTVITCEGTVTKIFDFTINNPKLITKLNEARKAKWLKEA